MAIIHAATLNPSKMELLTAWLPGQPWFGEGEPTDLERVGSFRFDDPEGEVGVETLLVARKDAVFQVPLTYRSSPLRSADASLIGTMEHSVLGRRWVYDATGDPVYASSPARTVLAGQPQADQMLAADGQLKLMPETVHLRSTGASGADAPVVSSAVPETVDGVTIIHAAHLDLAVNRVLDLSGRTSGQHILTATWTGQALPAQLAALVGVD
jgi:hypothetical protein